MGLNREYLIKKFEEPFVIAYRDYQVDLAVLFGADRTRAETEMAEVLEFEFALAEVTSDSTSDFWFKFTESFVHRFQWIARTDVTLKLCITS